VPAGSHEASSKLSNPQTFGANVQNSGELASWICAPLCQAISQNRFVKNNMIQNMTVPAASPVF
jgi:hypothetical protein